MDKKTLQSKINEVEEKMKNYLMKKKRSYKKK